MEKKEKKSYSEKSFWITNSVLVVLALIILLLVDNCHGKKEMAKETQLKVKNDSINLLLQKVADLEGKVSDLENRKAIPVVANKKTGNDVTAIIVDVNDERPSSIFIANIIVKVPMAPDSFPVVDSNCVKQLDSTNKEMDDLLNTNIDVCLDKTMQDTIKENLYHKRLTIRELIIDPPSYISHSYMIYSDNPYRVKAEKSFKRGIISGIISAGLYATSESLGNPKYWDGRDNSKAEKKSNIIFALRTGSAITGTYSAFEFYRAYKFHRMEGKFIIGPNRIGLTVNLD